MAYVPSRIMAALLVLAVFVACDMDNEPIYGVYFLDGIDPASRVFGPYWITVHSGESIEYHWFNGDLFVPAPPNVFIEISNPYNACVIIPNVPSTYVVTADVRVDYYPVIDAIEIAP